MAVLELQQLVSIAQSTMSLLMFQASVQSVHQTLTHLKGTTLASLAMLHVLSVLALLLTAPSVPLTTSQFQETPVRSARLATSLLKATTPVLFVISPATLVLESLLLASCVQSTMNPLVRTLLAKPA